MNSLLKSGNALLATFVVATAIPAVAMQSPAAPSQVPQSQVPQSQSSPATAPSTASPAAAQTPAGSPAAPAANTTPATSPAESMAAAATAPMSPVSVELVSKLDTKTAKTGDNLEARTRSSAKTADGTEIPKGSRLTGHVVAVQPSNAGANSQVVVAFDQLELKGGQSMLVHSEIESIGAAAEGAPAAGASAPASSAGAPRPTPSVASPAAGGGTNSGRTSSPAPSSSDAAAAPSGMPAAGTVVAKNGGIAIQTTSIPGILLANNAPGQQDPRMAKASSILLGAKRDVQLDGGTKMVVGIAASGEGR